MFWDLEITQEEEEEIIKKAVEHIKKYGIDVIAIMILESVKPLVYIWGQMGRFFISPFLPALGEKISQKGEKLFWVFEKRENVEKLIALLEKAKWEEHPSEKEEQITPGEEAPPKKGWRRFLPF